WCKYGAETSKSDQKTDAEGEHNHLSYHDFAELNSQPIIASLKNSDLDEGDWANQ
ncbi:hypothetical protein Angca_001291, partial [Angiostrongylus cantonensis]